MIHISIPTNDSYPELPKLRDQQARLGGSIIMYTSVWSALVVCRITTHLRLVSNSESRSLVGLFASMKTIFLGWWSVGGLFASVGALINNLSGGVDMTRVLSLESARLDPATRALEAKLIAARARTLQKRFLVVLVLLLLIVCYYVWRAIA